MARPVKKGLDYFPLDVDFFQDIKIRKLIKYQGGKSISVYTYLLCNIYKDGYYMKWDNELPFIISEATGYDEAYIREVIKCCLNIGLFSQNIFEKNNVLTSKGLQERFKLVIQSSKRTLDINEFNLINSEETEVNSEETQINSDLSTQRKGKEIKGKEIKGKEVVPDLNSPPPFQKNNFNEIKNFFNENRRLMPEVKEITDSRKKRISILLKNHGKDNFFKVIELSKESDFLNGINDRNWVANFDWITQPKNFIKILEENYKNKSNGSKNKSNNTDFAINR